MALELFELVDKGIIRIIDLVVIMKDQGQVIVRELRELDAAPHYAMFDPLQADVSQMIARRTSMRLRNYSPTTAPQG